MAGIGDFLKRFAGSMVPRRAPSRDIGRLERNMALVADDPRADLNCPGGRPRDRSMNTNFRSGRRLALQEPPVNVRSPPEPEIQIETARPASI